MDLASLRHHGDVDAGPGLLDFAVNVQGSGPPPWLRDRLVVALDGIGRYPAASHDLQAREAVAARHGRRPDEVLVLAGSAEGFALLPALQPRLAAVVHPGFTRPGTSARSPPRAGCCSSTRRSPTRSRARQSPSRGRLTCRGCWCSAASPR